MCLLTGRFQLSCQKLLSCRFQRLHIHIIRYDNSFSVYNHLSSRLVSIPRVVWFNLHQNYHTAVSFELSCANDAHPHWSNTLMLYHEKLLAPAHCRCFPFLPDTGVKSLMSPSHLDIEPFSPRYQKLMVINKFRKPSKIYRSTSYLFWGRTWSCAVVIIPLEEQFFLNGKKSQYYNYGTSCG